METLISYKNSPKLKKDFLREIAKHRESDAILQGTYGKENGQWRGCAIACSLRSLAILDGEKLVDKYDNHLLYETKLGIPEWLARLEDTIFEGLPKEDAMKWPEEFAEAVPVGVNLESVKWHFCAFLLKENIERVSGLKIAEELKQQIVKAIQGVLALHENAIKTGEWDVDSASSASSAALSAHSATRSAAHSASSASSAAYAAHSATRSAARSAAYSAYAAATRSAAYIAFSKELLKILKATK